MTHIGENAELYALGAFDETERIEIENHARNCLPCMKRLGNAERIVADLESEMPTIEPPLRLQERILKSVLVREKANENHRERYWGSLAAILLLGFLTTMLGLRLWQTDKQLRQNDSVIAALSNSEFGHLSLRSEPTAAPIAKAICEKHGGWIYLIVRKGDSNLTLYGDRNGNRKSLGRPVRQGQTATLFVENPGKFSALELVANNRVVASAKTQYPR